MIGAIRLAVFGFMALGVIYLLISIYARSVHKERLEKKWDAEVKTGDRRAYVEEGMRDYEGSLRQKLIWLVFVVPVVLVLITLFAINYT
jgi:uncharacterized ion transporter superfamily protein YfcC